MTTDQPNRRDFFKTTAVAAAGGVFAFADAGAPDAAEAKERRLTLAGYNYDRVAALADGTVAVEGWEVQYEADQIGGLNTHVFSATARPSILRKEPASKSTAFCVPPHNVFGRIGPRQRTVSAAAKSRGCSCRRVSSTRVQ